MILTICILFLGNIGVLPKFGPIDLKRPKICNLEDIPILQMLDNFFVIFLLSVNFSKSLFFKKIFMNAIIVKQFGSRFTLGPTFCQA